MLLNRPVQFMKLFNLAIENIERFKYVQDCSKYTTKKKKEIDNDGNGFALFKISKYSKGTDLCTIRITIHFKRL